MAILPTAIKPTDPNVPSYYYPEKEQMKMGFNLAVYGEVATFAGCGLIIVNIGLYIPFGDGKWIWQRKTEVVPNTENNIPEMKNKDNDNLTTQENGKKKGNIISVQEVDKH